MNTDREAGYGQPVTDRGKRLAAAHANARMVGGTGKWIAARLSDGGTDGVIYDKRQDAINHQLHETQCVYVQVQPDQMPAHEASQFLEVGERIYDSGRRLSDPDGTPMITSEQVPNLNRALRREAARNARRLQRRSPR